MIIFSPYWPYYIGGVLKFIETIKGGELLSKHLESLIEVRSELERFLEVKQHALFPETCERIKTLTEQITQLAPRDAPFQEKKLSFAEDISPLFTTVTEIHLAFKRESNSAFIIALEKQRTFDPDTLTISMHSAFSDFAWKTFSKLTKREIEESGRCLALERYTASGFHILRAVESEIRDYIWLITHKKPLKRDWGTYTEVLRDNGGDAKLIATLDNIRNLDRNPLMHPEDWLDQDDAIDIFNTGQTALRRLISDMAKKNLLRSE